MFRSVETNRKMITKMRLPPIDRNRSCNQSCMDEENMEITEKDEERKTTETRAIGRSETFTLGESNDKLNTVK